MNINLIKLDQSKLLSNSTSAAAHTLIASGLPKKQALTKLGLGNVIQKQINIIAEKYLDYYGQGEDIYIEKLERNSEANQEYIKNAINLYITLEQADSEFANRVVQSIVAGIDESPELALKVAERRWGDEWGAKKQTDVKIDTTSTIKTIQINVPTGETVDAEYDEVED